MTMTVQSPNRHIVIADDDVLTHWIVSEILVHAGFSVTNACRGAEVVALLEDGADFDLLLTATELPDHVDGRRLADRWMGALPGRPVIYCGQAGGSPTQMLRANEFFIAKPFGSARLLRLVDWALASTIVRAPGTVAVHCVPHMH